MATHKLSFSTNHFISEAGYVFKTSQGKEEIIPILTSPKTINPFVNINNKQYDLLYLMLEYFNVKVTPYDSVRYKLAKDNHLPLGCIKVIRNKHSLRLDEESAKLFNLYKCTEKANSANIRCTHKISANDVFEILNIYSYKCIYCQTDLKKVWHLDHYTPLSRGGKNNFKNIVPSCPRCNIMKGNMDGHQFVRWCQKVVNNNIISKQNEHFIL
jgi:5-methylcytosine-specific restriction endonuclease McrA